MDGIYENRGKIGAIGMFAIGILVGSAVGLLFAPRPGTDLRNRLSNRVNTIRPRLSSRRDRNVPVGSEYGTHTTGPSNTLR